MEFLDLVILVRGSNTLALVVGGFVIFIGGVFLHVDIKKNSRNGISTALRNFLYDFSALMFVSAAFPLWVNFRGSVEIYLEVVFVLYLIRLTVLLLMYLYLYKLVAAMLRSGKDC